MTNAKPDDKSDRMTNEWRSQIMMQGDYSKGRLIVVSGPSGAGKTTVLKEVFARCPRLELSVSATTRPPRPARCDGVDYYFLSRDEFRTPPARRRVPGMLRGFWPRILVRDAAKAKLPLDLRRESG